MTSLRPLAHHRLLIVDDEPDILTLVAHDLEPIADHIHAAKTAGGPLPSRSSSIDVVVCDLEMSPSGH